MYIVTGLSMLWIIRPGMNGFTPKRNRTSVNIVTRGLSTVVARIDMKWLIHTKEKPYQCAHKTFTQSSQKTEHDRIPTTEKPYKCVYVTKTFSASSYKNLDMSTELIHGKPRTSATNAENHILSGLVSGGINVLLTRDDKEKKWCPAMGCTPSIARR